MVLVSLLTAEASSTEGFAVATSASAGSSWAERSSGVGGKILLESAPY